MSARPGSRYLPRPSTTVAPAGTCTDAAGPSAMILPPLTTTVCRSSTRSVSIGITFTSTNATGTSLRGTAIGLAVPAKGA